LVEFFIIDVQVEDKRVGKYTLATVECALSHDLSVTFFTRTHLGAILHPGDHAKGYYLNNANFNNPTWEEYTDRIARSGHRQTHLGGGIPDAILIRKSYPQARKKNRGRKWRLRKLAKEKEEGEEVVKTRGTRQAALSVENTEKDYELFLRDLEEDVELRGMVNLFKDDRDAGAAVEDEDMDMDQSDAEEPEDDYPEIQVDELLENMDSLDITRD
jgi:nonsense-mediated mRNA decay protein 3